MTIIPSYFFLTPDNCTDFVSVASLTLPTSLLNNVYEIMAIAIMPASKVFIINNFIAIDRVYSSILANSYTTAILPLLRQTQTSSMSVMTD